MFVDIVKEKEDQEYLQAINTKVNYLRDNVKLILYISSIELVFFEIKVSWRTEKVLLFLENKIIYYTYWIR